MKILMFGKTGQVARDVVLAAQEAGDVTVIALDRSVADLSDTAACVRAIENHAGQVDVVVNAAAYTAVDNAEKEPELAQVINGDTPGAMATACAAAGLPFLHISTDYVFEGNGAKPWRVNDATGPLSVYGRTKLDGEKRIAAAQGQYALLRTAWVSCAHGSNFVKTMLRLAQTRDALSVVGDQIGGPTPARAIAHALITIARAFKAGQGATGIYHFAGAPFVSWADFARAIFDQANCGVIVTNIASSEYPTPAVRPLNSRLDCDDLLRDYAIAQPDWSAGLADVLAALDTGAK